MTRMLYRHRPKADFTVDLLPSPQCSMSTWDLPDGDDRPTRISVFAILSVVCGGLTAAVCVLVVLVLLLVQQVESPLVQILSDLLALLGFYGAAAGIACHFVARRRIMASAIDSDFKLEGDFTALVGFSLSLLTWCFLQASTQIVVRWGSALLVAAGSTEAASESAMALLNTTTLVGFGLIGVLYVLVSGPPVAKLLTPVLLILLPILLLISGMLWSREDARRTLLQHRLGRMWKGVQRQQDLHPDFGTRKPNSFRP